MARRASRTTPGTNQFSIRDTKYRHPRSLVTLNESEHRSRRGFTIVELVIVIAVIAILAVVVVVGYNGATKQATEVSMKSDLHGAAAVLEIDHRHNNTYPATAGAANGGAGLQTSKGNTLDYVTRAYGYCVSVTNPQTTKTFHIKSTDQNRIEEGGCQSIVATLAGNATIGYRNGDAATARFRAQAIAAGPDGNVYVADYANQYVRKVTPNGYTTSYAGSGTTGTLDGSAAQAQFDHPVGVAVAPDGTVYVSDLMNNRIRKITTSGVVSTFAGSTEGFANGTGTAAQFDSPHGLVVDSAGNVYVADSGNHRIRKITPAGVVTTLAGSGSLGNTDGAAASARFYNPTGMQSTPRGLCMSQISITIIFVRLHRRVK